MKRVPALFAVALLAACSGGFVLAGQPLTPGVKFCPAPGSDNSEFIDTHFGIDAKTGKLTKYTGTVHPDETNIETNAGEQVLYVAPPISVENRYVPPPGARAVAAAPAPAPMPPAAFQPAPAPAMRQPARRPQTAPAPVVASTKNGKKLTATAPSSRQQREGGARLPWWKRMWRN